MSESRNAVDIVRTRAMIEANIERCRDSAAGNLVEIGRWLNRAKKENVVPHGEWTSWVMEHAGMNERTAQRMMQAARELPEGSPLERLGIAKLSALLTLPAGEREDAAEAMDAQHISSREVADKVAAIRRERDEALRLVGEQKKRLNELDAEKDRAVLDAVNRAQRESREEIDRLNSVLKSGDIGRRRTQKLLEEANARERSLRDQVTDLSCRLQQAEHASMSPEAAAEIARLKTALADRNAEKDRLVMDSKAALEREQKLRAEAERELDRLTDELDEARTAALRGGSTEARRSPESTILSAIGALMAEAGRAPGELARQASAPDGETRALLIGQARMLGQWAMQVIAACGGETHGGV